MLCISSSSPPFDVSPISRLSSKKILFELLLKRVVSVILLMATFALVSTVLITGNSQQMQSCSFRQDKSIRLTDSNE